MRPGENRSRMWMSTFSRLALPALRRSTSAAAYQALWARPGSGQTAGPLRSYPPSVQHCEQHTLGSASLPLARHLVRQARALNEERMVEVEWEDGGHSMYPFTWLRDNCQCPICYLESAQARKLLMSDVDVNTGVDVVEVTNDSKVRCCHNLTCVFLGSYSVWLFCIKRKRRNLSFYATWMCKCPTNLQSIHWVKINFL